MWPWPIACPLSERAALDAAPESVGAAPTPVALDFEPLSPPESGPESGDEYDSE